MTSCHAGTYVLYEPSDTVITESIVDLQGNVIFLLTSEIDLNGNPIMNIFARGDGIYEIRDENAEYYTYLGKTELATDLLYTGYWTTELKGNQSLTKIGTYYNYGYINRQHLWTYTQQFVRATELRNEYAVVETDSGSEDGYANNFIMDKNGNIIVVNTRGLYFDNTNIYEGFSRMCSYSSPEFEPLYTEVIHTKEKRWFYLNVLENRLVDNAGYEDARDFSEGCAAVKVEGEWGYIDSNGEWLIPPKYQKAFDFSEGYAYVAGEDEAYFIDKSGNEVSEKLKNFQWAGNYHNGIFAAQDDKGKYNLYLISGKRLLPKSGFSHLEYINGVWICGSAPYDAGIYIPAEDKYIRGDTEPAIYKDAAVIGYKETDYLYDLNTGDLRCKYEYIGEFHEGLACVNQGRKCGYININGELVIDLQTIGSFFSNGLAPASLDTGEIGALANPLIYDTWSVDEYERASKLGLTVSKSDDILYYDEMWERIKEVIDLTYKTRTLFATEDAEVYNVNAEELKQQLEALGYPDSGQVDRQHLALALTELSRCCGRPVDCYKMFYTDSAEVSPECSDAMAYISSINIFYDYDGNIDPYNLVTESQATLYLLRFFENSLLD